MANTLQEKRAFVESHNYKVSMYADGSAWVVYDNLDADEDAYHIEMPTEEEVVNEAYDYILGYIN